MSSLGIDIGGANLKVASNEDWEIIYFPVWKMSDRLEKKLWEIKERYGAKKAGVVITAELADVFRNKEEGVVYIANTCKEVFDEVRFLDVEGRVVREIDTPRNFAASNWVASTSFLLREGQRNFLFVDIGSTTTDVIPVTDRILASKTDFERLKRGEMLYFGVLRTPVFYVLREFENTPLCPEYFAITADVFRILGDVSEDDYTCETPDGKGKSVEESMVRLARTICCDLDELGVDKAVKLANAAKRAMVDEVARAVEEKFERFSLEKVIGCGVGEFLIEEACKKADVEFIGLSDVYGDYSRLFPAYAMLKLVENE